MKALRQFRVDIYKLANKVHDYDFVIEDTFFENFEDSIVEKGRAECYLKLDKSETMMKAEFLIKGAVELVCDRSVEIFDYPIEVKETLLIKFGEEDMELDDQIVTIKKDTQSINVAQFLYEYITMAIPMKKLHPKFDREDFEDSMVYRSESGSDKENTDPRWDALKNLK